MENLNSHERALPVRTEVSKLHQSIVITIDKVLGALGSLIEQFTGEDLSLRDEVMEEAR